MFYKNIRPAINVGKSVSRVGGAAQVKGMRQVAGTLKLDLAQFRALESFSAFASDLDESSKKQLARGERLVEILKQKETSPLSVAEQICSIFAATKGHLDLVESSQVILFEKEFLEFLNSKHASFMSQMAEKKKLDSDSEKTLEEIIEEFKAVFKKDA